MKSVLRFGASSSVDLEFSEGALLAECGVPRGPSCDPSAAVAAALAEPLEYPPLRQSTLSSDHVVVALESGVPRAAEVVAAAVRALVEAGVGADGITVLRTPEDVARRLGDPSSLLPQETAQRIRLLAHDPGNRETMAYLAAGEQGEPILLHRALTDADVVLPIGSIQARVAGGYGGVGSLVFPSFSDHRTLQRFRSYETRALRLDQRRKLSREVAHVGWLLGLTFAIQVVPGPGDQILHVLAGEVSAIRRRGRELYQEAWRCTVPHRARLVVAGIEGGAAEQTWQNVGRAVAAAANLAEDGGTIAVCCDLDGEPGPAVQYLAEAPTRQEAVRQIRRERPVDALPATQLAQALERVKVYLFSRLDETLLEDLEIGPIHEVEELVRLTQRHESCILLSNASRAMVRKEAE